MSTLEQSSEIARPNPIRPDVAFAASIAGALAVLWCVLFRETLWNMVSIWARSETFMHGFLIVPLAGYLVYVRRETLRTVPIVPFLPGLVVLAALCGIWFAGWSAGAEVVQQFAAIGIVIALVLVVFGSQFAKRIAGPLAYLFFAVPFGEILIAPLREFTADSIMIGLNLTGIAVVRAGFYLSTSVGEFAVERACSGLRYLIASFALGTLFSMLYLSSRRRQVIFILLSLIVPVVANGVRAYLIVILAHLSSLKIATGVDHIIYGWIFFGLVMFLLFLFGARMEDRHRASTSSAVVVAEGAPLPRNRVATAAIACALVLLIGPVFAQTIESRERGRPILIQRMPDLGGDWTMAEMGDRSWVPDFPRRFALTTGSYVSGDNRIDVAAASYGESPEIGALIGFGNRTINSKIWPEHGRSVRTVELSSGMKVNFLTVAIDSSVTGKHRAVWYTYLIGAEPVADDYWGKARQAWTRIESPGRRLWSFAFSAESKDSEADLNGALAAFVQKYFAAFAAQPGKAATTNRPDAPAP